MLRIEVIHCPRSGVCDRVLLLLPEPATVLQALQASGVLQRHALAFRSAAEGAAQALSDADGGVLSLGIWNQVCTLQASLRDGDRVEIHRPLQVDPKEARRQRHRRGTTRVQTRV